MKPYGGGIPAEIAMLQRRADQLSATNLDTDAVLASLTREAAAARTLADLTLALRLDRKIRLVQERRTKTTHEIDTLLSLVAARRARYGLPTT
ncbi:MAG TPA: hypothetical protein VF160_16305 [Candidatus Dormibacteraeota bacterium]